MRNPITVVHFQRRTPEFFFSIERVFSTIRHSLPECIGCRVVLSRFESRGLFRRIYNALEAAAKQGQINHVTGDVHYLTYFLRKCGTLLTVHDCGGMTQLHGFSRWLFRLLWLQIPVDRSSLITTVSEFSKQELLRYVNCRASRVRVIGDPVHPQFISNSFVFNAQSPVILQVGTTPNKNIERLAEALRGISCHLHIIGRLSPSQRQALEDNRIQYTLFASLSDTELLQRYRECDMVVFASVYEGFGMPIIEANAIGRPVVTSNVCSMPEVAHDAACLVNPFDPASIRAGIIRVINEAVYRKTLIENGFRNAPRFRAEVIAEQYASLYQEIFPGIHRRHRSTLVNKR